MRVWHSRLMASTGFARGRRTDVGKAQRPAAVEPLESRTLLSTTYYISPTGNDGNAGTSPAAPWKTVAKVDAAAFNPGDQILFQRGGQWRESLNASSSGTINAPITYGAYGDAALPNPLFIGSNVLDNSSFSPVSGTTSTYSLNTTATINWVFDNHTFTHASADVTRSGDAATNLNYVNSTPGSWYQSGSILYVNVGGDLSGHVLTAAVRQNAVYSNGKNNLVFTDLDVTETAQDNGGYAFYAYNSSNVQMLNCNASLAGKHHFSAINSTNFVGRNLVASYAPPDLGFGAASAFVSFSDALRTGDTYQWTDCTWQNPNGPYPAFITHGNPNAIASIAVTNMDCGSGWGTGIVGYSTSSTERITIKGGTVRDGYIELDTDYSSIDGVTLTGNGAINLVGSHDLVQNCTFTGRTATPFGGQNGSVTDSGQFNTIQFNTFSTSSINSNAIGIMNGNTNTQSLGNIFNCPMSYWLVFTNSNGTVLSNDNLFKSSGIIRIGSVLSYANDSLAQWQVLGEDSRSLVAANAQLDLANGGLVVHNGNLASINFFLQTGYDKGKWDGLGLISSTAAQNAAHLTTLGAILNNNGSGTPLFTTFNGQSVGATDVLVKYTYYGDADLSGHVDGTDYSLIDHGFNSPGASGWTNGDFNYDGKIDGSDYSLIDNAFNMQGLALPQTELSPAIRSNSAPLAASPPQAALLAVPSAIPNPDGNNWLHGIFSDQSLRKNDGLLKDIFG